MALVNNSVKENFQGKRKKKAINILTIFFISHKSDVKTFIKWIVKKLVKTQFRWESLNLTQFKFKFETMSNLKF